MIDPSRPAFHARDGLMFQRQENGAVLVVVERGSDRHYFSTEIPADSWASVIAFCSVRGETVETFHEAEAFHNRKE